MKRTVCTLFLAVVLALVLVFPVCALLDVDLDKNDALDIASGGTNATNAGDALTNLGAGDITSVLDDTSGAVTYLRQAWTAFGAGDASPDVSTFQFGKTIDTTTITGFDHGGSAIPDGRELYVYCGAATVFDLTSSEITAANRSTDYTCAVGTILEFVYQTDQWYTLNIPDVITSIADPDADRIYGWDDSETAPALFTPAGGLEISTTNLQIADDGIVKAKFGDEDWGDVSVSSNSVTIDAGVVNAAKSATVMKTDGACISLGNGTDAITAGAYYDKAIRIPFKATLTKVILTTSKTDAQALTIDVWIDAPGATTGLSACTDADSLFDTATEPAIADASADNYFEVASFDSGEDAIAAGDWIVVNADGSPTLTQASVCFEFTRTD